MALLIDIYRYQTVTDPAAVKRAGVAGAYVKATDGGGKAIVPADNQVRQMRVVGIPVGLYHYAQLSPSPEIQADILCSEVARLGAVGLPPALDLEDPWAPGAAARNFAIRFLNRVRANGFPYVTVYGNTSMFDGIGVETLGVSGLIVWEANYGVDNGARHPLPARARKRHIHQYTSEGRLPGISGRVDLNESLAAIPGVDDMDLTQQNLDDIAKAVWERQLPHLNPGPGDPTTLPARVWGVGANMGAWGAVNRIIALEGRVAGLETALAQLDAGEDIDLEAIRQAAQDGAEKGAEEALAAGVVDVHVTVADKTDNQ
jgi:GH25 family lysozyme M1 (1,4-beta-N-acetylmuramidase)